jgi:glycosidase
MRPFLFLFAFLFFLSCNSNNKLKFDASKLALDSNTTAEVPVNNKLIIYQIMTRLFANENTTNLKWGTIEQNGVSKFNDINNAALQSIKKMGVTHVWYTGVIEHATMANNADVGIELDDVDFVKGRAGSPYAIKDYYDVDPDLASDKTKRMAEFENLIERTHQNGLNVVIDFVPNHVARNYKSDVKLAAIIDLGAMDNTKTSFSNNNNFYYLPGKLFKIPAATINWPIDIAKRSDGKFTEYPAKVSGNNVFSEVPNEGDWYETIKLNYGVDYSNAEKKNFDTIPNTWLKMTDILLFWAAKGVDGFRCDMAEMVPVEFWNYAISKVKSKYPKMVFIAEIYNTTLYKDYINIGGFNYLYDKSGLYDILRAIAIGKENTRKLYNVWHNDLNGISNNMLRFLENHDEQRLASKYFIGNAANAKAIMAITATLNSGPALIYFGQELGEAADSVEGFGGNDGRTTIFDYWAVPTMKGWVNGKKFDGALLNKSQIEIKAYYSTLLNFCKQSKAINQGVFYNLPCTSTNDSTAMVYMRLTANEQVLVISNLCSKSQKISFNFSPNLKKSLGIDSDKNWIIKDLFTQTPIPICSNNNAIEVPAYGVYILPFK